jgi:hypothetical protein
MTVHVPYQILTLNLFLCEENRFSLNLLRKKNTALDTDKSRTKFWNFLIVGRPCRQEQLF